MRTTITIDDTLMESLKEIAYRSGKSLKDVLNETLRAGLSSGAQRSAKRYRLQPASLGTVRPGIDLDRALRLSDALEDEELARKLEMRK